MSLSFYHNLHKTPQIFWIFFQNFYSENLYKFYELNEKFTLNFLWIFQKFSKCSQNFFKTCVKDLIKFSWTFNFFQYFKTFPNNPGENFKDFLHNYISKTFIYLITLIIENITNCMKIYQIFATNFPKSFSKGPKFS